MEDKSVVAVLVTMMIVMGSLLTETEAQKITFAQCFPACLVECKNELKFPKFVICPFTCLKTCLHPTPSPSPSLSPSPSPSPSSPLSESIIEKTDHFYKLGCAVNHCASLSTIENPNVEKVAACVDICSNNCSNKN